MRHCHVYLNKKLNWNPQILIHVLKYIQQHKYKHSHFFLSPYHTTYKYNLTIWSSCKYVEICWILERKSCELWLLNPHLKVVSRQLELGRLPAFYLSQVFQPMHTNVDNYMPLSMHQPHQSIKMYLLKLENIFVQITNL